ncbi:MAG: hypothetical protein HC813_00945 [Planctomycetes bacterium]|nr:hypothetical protein [Planctomycetota bacterium]
MSRAATRSRRRSPTPSAASRGRQEEQARAVHQLAEQVAVGNTAVRSVTEEMRSQAEAQRLQAEAIATAQRDQAAAQEAALKKVAHANQQTAKVIHVGNQKSLQAFQQATQKTLQSVQQASQDQQEQMRALLDASVSNMKRMFVLAAIFMGLAVAAVATFLFLR